MDKIYDPKKVEDKWYKFWEEKGYFHAEIPENRVRGMEDSETKKPFTIVIPPPNVTGSLHMGHALNNTLQDIIIRKKRMEGYETLWLPGTDHAGIATQNVVEKQLAKEGKTRQDIGREEFVKKVWRWKEEYGNTIINQLKRLGCSCDWDRLRFTMDDDYVEAVKEVFVRYYNEGLIYRGNYIINFCTRCLTALSDIEVEHHPVQGKLWHVRYPIKNSDKFIIVATTRPETMLGDTAVAVNPDDSRYQDLVGKKVILPLVGREIEIIADKMVDQDFGTGAVKVTPAHDPNDYETAVRHDLEKINIFTDEAVINENGGKYEGLDRYEARKKVVEDLEKQGLLEKIEVHEHAVGHCYRCDTVIEPRLSTQWFLKMKPLAQPAIKVVEDDIVKFVPKRWVKIYFEWMDNIRDWCISRQLWWGHRLPVWYCDCGEIIVQIDEPDKCPKCGKPDPQQEVDVLDTWFSSALWPFATLGWPKNNAELEYFYPTAVLSTSFDILYFWVARMIMSGLHFMGEIPFNDVYIHALIRDAEGKKMSKSRGNVIDPLDDINKYGADALRFTLASLAVPGRDVFLSQERVEGNRNFANKIWNAARFVISNLDGSESLEINENELQLADKWILSKMNRLIKNVDSTTESYDFSKAAKSLYDFFWSDFADWYIEISKPRLYGKEEGAEVVKSILIKVLDVFCRLSHPVIPFITEEIWQMLPVMRGKKDESIVVSPYPVVNEDLISETAEEEMVALIEVVIAARTVRSELRIKPSQKIDLFLKTGENNKLPVSKGLIENVLRENVSYIKNLVKCENIIIGTEIEKPEASAVTVAKGVEIFIPIKEIVDTAEELKRAQKELDSTLKDLKTVETKLLNKQFTEKAPPEIVQKERNKERELNERKQKLTEQLKILQEV